jgi:predicted phage terminase large subunit-like protein
MPRLIQDDKYFIAHVLVGQWEYHDLEKRVLSHADAHKPNVILVEDAGFGTALISTLKLKGLPVIAVKPEGDKRTRLLREIAKFANAQVFLLKTAPGRAELETELFNFPGGQRNDLVDALSQALSYKHVQPNLWTPQALENYAKFQFGLACSGF